MHAVMANSLQPHGLQSTRFLNPWDFPGKNAVVDCHFLLQEIFPTQGSNPCLLHVLDWQADSLPLCHLGSLSTSIQFSSVTQLSLTCCDPMDCRTPGFRSITNSQILLKLMSIELGIHLTIYPLSFPSPPAFNPSQHQGLFQ